MTTLSKPIDISKFQKSITKSIPNISTGFNDPTDWVSTGNFCLNKRLSGDFNRGIPLGRFVCLAGESGSSKSVFSASIVKNAQLNGIFCIYIDTENAIDESWLKKLGVDTKNNFLRVRASMINDVAKILKEFFDSYKSDYGALPKAERPKFLIVIDSMGALLSETDLDQFNKGEIKGDKGIKAKQLKAMMANCCNTLGDCNIGLLATNHTYKSQNMYDPTDILGAGTGWVYYASLIAILNKYKLKEDEDGNKTTDVQGIRAVFQLIKTRYSKPFVKVEVNIPYDGGIDPYSGLVEYFESLGIVKKVGNKLSYISKSGTEYKEFRKNFGPEILDIVMSEWDSECDKLEVASPEEGEE